MRDNAEKARSTLDRQKFDAGVDCDDDDDDDDDEVLHEGGMFELRKWSG